ESAAQFRTYHKFLILNVSPIENVSFEAEVLDLSYYELIFHVSEKYDVRVGKIWVPFGSSPFHHYYGGIQGDPFSGLLVPNVWAEFGGTVGGSLYTDETIAVDADVFLVRGFESELGNVLNLSSGGSDGNIAIGARTKFGIGGKFSVWGSVMYNRFGEIEAADDGDEVKGEVLLWGGDIVTEFGLIDVPLLRDLRVRAAFARADVKDELLVDPVNSKEFWYYKYGDYVELTHRGYRGVVPRVRYGTIIDFDDRVTNNDSHNWDLALLYRMGRHVLFLAEYQINMEEVNERNNDLARFQIVFEF
ncbi:MAG: hypothetical protein HKN32_03705, partial [Flavobacteriales bacterium]|nr:hypothetical protein [Flavobacteriales bacterium]